MDHKQAAEKRARTLLQNNTLCVLATATLRGKPEAATVLYAEGRDMNVYIQTSFEHRKYAHLKANPQASVVVTEAPYTLQMDGSMQELSGPAAERAKTLLIAKRGPSRFDASPRAYFRFTPNWIRVLLDPKAWPPLYVVIKG
ncbi:MAG: pyridoxamine 5'-phosphate oxidase family protein [Candidatus Aenigmarchaeota archaeon]|nr:pyridoxamine 5'-phosphate oxidase family protein [Candidatus Aenigmarchaeota archaeon]